MSSSHTPSARVTDILLVAMAVSLVVACVDLWMSVLDHARELASLRGLADPLAATALVFFAAFMVSGAPAVRIRRLDGGAVAVGLAAFGAGVFTIVALIGVRHSVSDLFRYLVAAVVSVLLGFGAYAVARAHREPRSRGGALALPWAAALTLAFLWMEAYSLRTPVSAASAVLAVAWAALVVGVVAAGARLGATPWPRRALVVLFAAVVVAPLPARLGGGSAPETAGSSTLTPRHVFLIVIDTLRRDALSCYGDDGAPTPQIDALAADGTLFEDAVSASSWTLPAMCSMMTGLATDVHGTIQYHQALHDSVNTLADLLGAAGYNTAAIGSNPMLSPAVNVGQGFATYDWYPRAADDDSFGRWVLRRAFPRTNRRDLTTEELTDAAIAWVQAHRDESTFLWMHLFDPHHPYTPPARFLPEGTAPPAMRRGFEDRKLVQAGTLAPTAVEREWIRKLYLGEVRYVDEQVGRFIDALRGMGLYDDALIVLTSDHGEEFWDHGGFEHGHTLYRELLDVPLIVKTPGATPRRRVSTLVPTQSVTPTILDLCGVAYDPAYMSASLTPLLSGAEGTYVEKPVFSGGLRYYADRESVTDPRYVYIRSKVSGRELLFDRVADPLELHPLGPGHDAVLEAERAAMDAHVLTVPRAQAYLHIEGGWQANLDRDTIRRLKALGYI